MCVCVCVCVCACVYARSTKSRDYIERSFIYIFRAVCDFFLKRVFEKHCSNVLVHAGKIIIKHQNPVYINKRWGHFSSFFERLFSIPLNTKRPLALHRLYIVRMIDKNNRIKHTVTRWVSFVSVGVGANQRIPLSVLARNPHKGLAHETSHGTGRGRGKEGPSD